MQRLVQWSVTSFWAFMTHLHPRQVRAESLQPSATLLAGVLSVVAFVVLVGTGVYLMYYYVPDQGGAWQSVRVIEERVRFGSMMRAMHAFAADLMVAAVALHVVSLVLRGAFERRKLANWMIGVALMVGTVALAYTGYLLPYDQLAYWATTVGVNMAASAPGIGDHVAAFLLGGSAITTDTLLRFYVHHCITVPLGFAVLLALHMFRIRRDKGLTLPRRLVREQHQHWVLAQPVLLHWEVLAFVFVTLLLTIAAFLHAAPLGPLASGSVTPNPMKAPWYLVGLQELLHYYPPFLVSWVLPLVALVALALLPLLGERQRERTISELSPRGTALLYGGLALVVLVSLLAPPYPDGTTTLVTLVAMAAVARARRGGNRLDRSVPTFLVLYGMAEYAALVIVAVWLRGPGWRLVF